MVSFLLKSLLSTALLMGLTACELTQTAAPKSAALPITTAPAATEWVNGEVTKLDTERSRITLKHAPIASIKMDAMTMPFKVKDKALLDGRKVGEKVQFAVRVDDGDLFITQMRSMP